MSQEAELYGKVNIVASSKDENFSYIPDLSDLSISDKADYVYICENNTIYGTTIKNLPNTNNPIITVTGCSLADLLIIKG